MPSPRSNGDFVPKEKVEKIILKIEEIDRNGIIKIRFN